MLLMSPTVPPLSDCVFEGLFLTSVSLVCLVTVTEVQLTGHILNLTLCEAQFFIMQTPVSRGYC